MDSSVPTKSGITSGQFAVAPTLCVTMAEGLAACSRLSGATLSVFLTRCKLI